MTHLKKSSLQSEVPGLSERLWELQRDHGGVTAFSRLIGQHDTKAVEKWLREGVVPGGRMLAKIAVACNVSVDWLLLGVEPKQLRVTEEVSSLPDALARYVAHAVAQGMGQDLALVGDGHRLLQDIVAKATEDFREATDRYRQQRQLRAPLLHVHSLLDSLQEVLPSLSIGSPDAHVKGAQEEIRDECAFLVESLGEMDFQQPAVWLGPDSTVSASVLISDPYDQRVAQLPAYLRRLAAQQEAMRGEGNRETQANDKPPTKGKRAKRP